MLFRTNLAEQKAFCSILFGSFSLVFQKNVFRMTLVKDIPNTKTDQRRSLFLQEEKELKNSKLFSLLATMILSLVLFSCGSAGGGIENSTPEAEPGTIGQPAAALLAASELSKTLDTDNSKTILFYYRPDGNYSGWGLWIWEDGGKGEKSWDTSRTFSSQSVTYDSQSYNIGYMILNPSDFESSAPTLKEAIENKKNLNFIIRKTDGWTKDPGLDQAFDLAGGTHFMVLSGDSDVYPISSVMTPFISSATMETLTTMKVALSVKLALTIDSSANGFSVVSTDGATISIQDIVNYNAKTNRYKNFTNTLLVTLDSEIDASKVWKISRESFGPEGGRAIATQNAIKISLNDFSYEGNDLGLTLSDDGKATFKTWAPVSSDVKILFYDDVSKIGNFKADTVAAKASGSCDEETLKGEPSAEESMVLDKDTGIWSYTLDSIGSKKYYKYQITNNGTVYYVADIWHTVAAPDSIASQIVSINDSSAKPASWENAYTNPFGNSGADEKKYSDAVIYEMHIRDWSRAFVTNSTGKFKDISDNLGSSGKFAKHLKDLGITHVQILPMFDYAQVNADENYNWGYNPYHYNVPEGRYVKDFKDGTDAVQQMREMIKAFHDAGIAVIMDVVYNHTASTGGGSLYDSTVPYYFYRLNADGTYSNGSGVGNEVDSEAPMMKKYIIDSLKHWMNDYHINGFRFDLMGVHDKSTMKDIYSALYEIDKNVIVYGEPWTGGNALVKDSANQAFKCDVGSGVGAFEDDFRNAVKGAEFGGLAKGQIQGEFGTDGNLRTGLMGRVISDNNRNPTGLPELALHYAECHDNYTLYDKLVYTLEENFKKAKTADEKGNIATVWPASVTDVQTTLIKKQTKLAAAYIFLSQGTPFINGGQEFMRTKKGNPDSYAADTKGGVEWTNTEGQYNIDDVNTVDLSFKDAGKNQDVYNVYKGLIALRKANPSAFGANTSAKAAKLADGVTEYTAGDFLVYFNASDSEYSIKDRTSAYTKLVDVTSGTPAENTTIPEKVEAKSFVILKK